MAKHDVSIMVCVNQRFTPGKPCCTPTGFAIADNIEKLVKDQKLPVEVERIHCFGYCEKGSNVRIAPGGKFFHGVEPDKLDDIIETAIGLAEGDLRRTG